MPTESSTSQKTVLEFKSTSLTVPVLLLADNDLSLIERQLQEKISQAPEFFKNSPVLIDLQKLNAQNQALSISTLVDLIRNLGFMPIGFRAGNEQQNAQVLALNLPVHNMHTQNVPLVDKKNTPKVASGSDNRDEAHAVHLAENKLLTQPVRSGQRVYAKGDLTIIANVSTGAEIMAEGNIHVYGVLRGRALAGVLGNTESRIFCSALQAELISIAGTYQLSDDLSSHATNQPVQISLENQKLIIKNI
jgi:septum site-determining protein MinC